MEISAPVQLEYSTTAPAGATGAGARSWRIRIDTSRKTFTEDIARVKQTLIPRGRTIIAGLALGFSTYMLYLLIQCLLPAQGSGMAILGERFSGSW